MNKNDFYKTKSGNMVHTTGIQVTPVKAEKENPADYSPLLLLPLAIMAAHHFTKKQMRKAKRKMLWQFLKMKLKDLFSPKTAGNKRFKLLLILLGGAFAIGLGIFVSWPLAGALLLLLALIYIPWEKVF